MGNPVFSLIRQKPKPSKPVEGVLSVGKDGSANFFEGDGSVDCPIACSMERVKLEWAGANGIMLSGFEKNAKGFIYQEWYLEYLNR